MLRYTYQSLDGKFPRELTRERQSSRFDTSWKNVLALLDRELHQLDYNENSLVFQTAHRPYDVRNDGMLRSYARVAQHPGVVIKFDSWDYDRKKWMPMSFECDQFLDWKDNVQAIALAMEALRKVDRYNVTSRGRSKAHYEGYKALPSAEGRTTTKEDAAAFMATHSGFNRNDIMENPQIRAEAFRKAAQALHPDKDTGSHEDFLKLQESVKTLNGAIQL